MNIISHACCHALRKSVATSVVRILLSATVGFTCLLLRLGVCHHAKTSNSSIRGTTSFKKNHRAFLGQSVGKCVTSWYTQLMILFSENRLFVCCVWIPAISSLILLAFSIYGLESSAYGTAINNFSFGGVVVFAICSVCFLPAAITSTVGLCCSVRGKNCRCCRGKDRSLLSNVSASAADVNPI